MYSIKDIEELTGIKAHTIRIWEQRYELLKPTRNESNVREYCNEELKKILNISLLYKNGNKISHIAQYTEDEIKERVLQLNQNTDFRIEELIAATLDFDELRFVNTLNSCILENGFIKAFTNVIYPYYEKIGLLWQVNTVRPSQEHFASNLIKQQLQIAIGGIVIQKPKKTCIALLHSEEMHEINLLYNSYLLKKEGIQVYYLGQIVPDEDLPFLNEKLNPDIILTAFIKNNETEWFNEYSNRLLTEFKHSDLIISGYCAPKVTLTDKRIHIIKSSKDLDLYLAK